VYCTSGAAELNHAGEPGVPYIIDPSGFFPHDAIKEAANTNASE